MDGLIAQERIILDFKEECYAKARSFVGEQSNSHTHSMMKAALAGIVNKYREQHGLKPTVSVWSEADPRDLGLQFDFGNEIVRHYQTDEAH